MEEEELKLALQVDQDSKNSAREPGWYGGKSIELSVTGPVFQTYLLSVQLWVNHLTFLGLS